MVATKQKPIVDTQKIVRKKIEYFYRNSSNHKRRKKDRKEELQMARTQLTKEEIHKYT